MVEQKVLEEFVQGLKPEPKDTNTVHTAIVSNIDDEGVVWVNINGSDKETPTELVATEVKRGDAVTVQWRNNKLYVASNYTNPSAGVVRVSVVEAAAQTAQSAANNAVADAGRAKEAAEDAIATAESVHSIAQQAAEDAAEAKTSATNASEYASRALGNLSTVQSVTETLNWITAHGTMTLTSDTALDPSHVYFVRNNDGDYVVGGNHYSVVTEPNVDNISTYYELTIDESLNNYVGTHLSVTSEGLWLLPDAGGNKVLIATGQGQTYMSAGTYIVGKVNGVDTVLASFLASGVQIGQDSESHLNMDYHSMQLIDKEGSPYFYISDLRDSSGYVIIEEYFRTDGISNRFTTMLKISEVLDISAYGVSDPPVYSINYKTITFDEVPAKKVAGVYVRYKTNDRNAKAFTLGTRDQFGVVGPMSFAEGDNITASGLYSHAEGSFTIAHGESSHAEGDSTNAGGKNSHAEGYHSMANGLRSHAQNFETIASGLNQTALGRYNIEDNDDTYSVIIGNGTNDNNRSNALTVDWQGNVKTAGSVTENNGTRDIDLTISEATIQKYVNLGMSLT